VSSKQLIAEPLTGLEMVYNHARCRSLPFGSYSQTWYIDVSQQRVFVTGAAIERELSMQGFIVLKPLCLRNTGKLTCEWFFVLLSFVVPAQSQFKEIGPPPFSPAIAHQKMKQLLTSVTADNRKQTVQTLAGWVAWYRDILDEELVAAWRRNARANLPEVIMALSDDRVASDLVKFSWRESRQTTFNLAYAPMLTSLMSRYSKSAEPFLQDLLAQSITLSRGETEGVCRILLDMPDVGTWKESSLQILPRYTEVARELLTQDLHASDEETRFRSEMWMLELKLNAPTVITRQGGRQRNPPPYSAPDAVLEAPRRMHVDGPPVPVETELRPARPVLPTVSIPQVKLVYDGPKSGTYESMGSPIPQGAEYVFRNLPLVNMRLDYDSKLWEARLVPGENKTQRLIVRNKSTGPQKRCIVHWSVVQ
jgi:hypothetical protein